MRFTLILVLSFLVPAQVWAKDSPKKLCFETRISVPLIEWATADPAKLAAEQQVPGCSAYLQKFKVTKKERASIADKKLRALLIRAKAYTILGDKAKAIEDIANMRSIADAVGYSSKLSIDGGVGLTLKVLESINSEDPYIRFREMASEEPFYEPYQQIALTYALEQEDYRAAAQFATLSDKLNEEIDATIIKGYLLEIAGLTDEALLHYQLSIPSLDTYIRQAHIFLQKNDMASSKEAYEKALLISEKGRDIGQGITALFFASMNDRRKTITPLLQKRLDILKNLYEIQNVPAEQVFSKLFQKSTEFGHFELVSAMQYAGKKMQTPPEHVLLLDSSPQLPAGFSPVKTRNSWVNKLLKDIPKGKPRTSTKNQYSKKVSWLSWSGLSKGFKSNKNEDGTYTVSYEGAVRSDISTVVELTLFGAAEFVLEKKKKYFLVKGLNKYRKQTSFSGGVYLTKMVIELVDERYEDKAFDAAHVKETLSAKFIKDK